MGKEPSEIEREIEQTRADLSQDAEALREEVRQQGGVKGVAGQQAKKQFDSVSEKAKTELKSAPQRARQELKSMPEKVKTVEKKVQQRPLASVAVAAGTGWLLRSVIKRRSRG